MRALQIEHNAHPTVIGDEVGRDENLPVHIADFEIHHAASDAFRPFIEENEDWKPPRSISAMRLVSPKFLAGGGVHQAAFHFRRRFVPFVKLHFLQAGRRFAGQFEPPRDNGTT